MSASTSMNIQTLSITNQPNAPFYTLMKEGKKTVDVRLVAELGKMKIGNLIHYSCEQQTKLSCRVENIKIYDSLDSLLILEDPYQIYPNHSILAIKRIYSAIKPSSSGKPFAAVHIQLVRNRESNETPARQISQQNDPKKKEIAPCSQVKPKVQYTRHLPPAGFEDRELTFEENNNDSYSQVEPRSFQCSHHPRFDWSLPAPDFQELSPGLPSIQNDQPCQQRKRPPYHRLIDGMPTYRPYPYPFRYDSSLGDPSVLPIENQTAERKETPQLTPVGGYSSFNSRSSDNRVYRALHSSNYSISSYQQKKSKKRS